MIKFVNTTNRDRLLLPWQRDVTTSLNCINLVQHWLLKSQVRIIGDIQLVLTLHSPDTSHWLETGGCTFLSTLKISIFLLNVLKETKIT